MYYIIYKTINLINNKFYIGMHSTLNLEDGYLGSGKIILSAIRLYGKANFSREILHLCDSEEEMILKEIEIVNEELVKDENCYNLRMGGTGLNSKNASELMLKLWKTEEFKNIMKSKYTEEYNLKLCAIQKEVQNRKEVKDKKSGTMRKKYSNSREIQNKISQSLKKYFSNPENIERLKSNSSNLWKNSEYKNKMSKAISKGQKRLWENNEYKNKMKNIYTERNIPINKEKIDEYCKENNILEYSYPQKGDILELYIKELNKYKSFKFKFVYNFGYYKSKNYIWTGKILKEEL